MSALRLGVYANPNRTLFEPNVDPLIVSSIVGLSSINGSPYGGGGGGPFETLSVSSMTVSTINGKPYPDPADAAAYGNFLQTSSMNLYQNSTTLVAWDGAGATYNINSSNYDLIVSVPGTYKIGASYQFNNTSGSGDVVRYFYLKNDLPINGTGSYQSVLNNTEQVSYSEILETLLAGDRIQQGLYTASPDIYLSTLGGPSGEVPTSPAVITTIYKIA